MKTTLVVAAALAVSIALTPATAGAASATAVNAASVAEFAPVRPDGRAALLGEVHREFAIVRATRYQHETRVDRFRGEFFYDCSGFVDYALGVARPAAVRALPSTASAGRPLAQDYVRHLRHPGGGAAWSAVPRVEDLRPGDVIAWLKTPDSASRDTGHVMVVLEAPTRGRIRYDEWLVRVADSTRDPHAADSRRGPDGLGTGTVGLVADRDGRPAAYLWRGGVSSELVLTEIALGRPL